MAIEKKDCYIFWDEGEVEDRRIYVQCEECYKKNGKGVKWNKKFLYGVNEINCNLCNTILYKKIKKKVE